MTTYPLIYTPWPKLLDIFFVVDGAFNRTICAKSVDFKDIYFTNPTPKPSYGFCQSSMAANKNFNSPQFPHSRSHHYWHPKSFPPTRAYLPIVKSYIKQILRLNPTLRAVIEVNPDALAQAGKADIQRKRAKRGTNLGPLHGIPVLLKDYIATKDKLNTTAGSYALLGAVVPRDAGVVVRLRTAGAIILGKASLSEWAHIRDFDIPDGWSARGGQGHLSLHFTNCISNLLFGSNPYNISTDPCGSSSGSAIAVAANMVAVSLGTETDVVGIKPTVGLTSRGDVIPISPRQDSIGPICRTVADAVYVLDAIVGFDSYDAKATRNAFKYIPAGGYAQFLKINGLRGKRLGMVRNPFFNFTKGSAEDSAFKKHLRTLRQRGAVLIDNLEMANIDRILGGKRRLRQYLWRLVSSPVRTLSDVISFNNKFKDLEMMGQYGQKNFLAVESTNGTDADTKEALLKLAEFTKNGFEKIMTENKLDAVLTPGADFASVLAIGGFPGISVPAGYKNDGQPFGICFGGLKGYEPRLIEIAYEFEQATKIRKPPPFLFLRAQTYSKNQAMAANNQPWVLTSTSVVLVFTSIILFPHLTESHNLSIQEATIVDIQRAFHQHEITSKQLVKSYINQIHRLNPTLRAIIEVNPDALAQAEKADRQRKRRSNLGPLHGIPVLVKDNIATKDKLNTTAGSYALLGSVVPRDAGVVVRLRKAGAVILGKASLSEWANFRGLAIPNGWSARGGQGLNPYNKSTDPCGSSSGSAIAVAANMVAVSLGTETDGSILCPASYNAVVGIKPTVGLTSRSGVVPITPRQDTIGPICRTVADAVYVLDAIVGFDSFDAKATRNVLKQRGAVLIDNLEIANIDTIMGANEELQALCVEFKISLNTYLKGLVSSPVRKLSDVISFNNKFKDLEMIEQYGQQIFLAAESTNAKSKKHLQKLAELTKNGFEKIMIENNLDTVLTPGAGFATVLAIGGFPGINVPAGYKYDGQPFGICFGGLKGYEPRLIEIAYDFEQATKIRKPPPLSFLKA
ncbi:hypothetical protein V2J09_002118 [Rumex salicifolius]